MKKLKKNLYEIFLHQWTWGNILHTSINVALTLYLIFKKILA